MKRKNHNLEEETKTIEKEIQQCQIKLDSLRNTQMPNDKTKKLNILLEIATCEDDQIKLKRKLQNIEKQMKRAKKSKNKHNNNDDIVSTMIDTALTLSAMKNVDNDNEDHVFNV